MPRRTDKVEIYLAKEESVLALLSTDLEHVFGSNVGKKIDLMLRGEEPHNLEFADDMVRIHSFKIGTDLI